MRKNDDIDLLFTDVVMPAGINGLELAENALKLRPGLKVLYTSGYTENAFMQSGHIKPGINLLSKPYGKYELARRIREVLDKDQLH